MSLYFWIIAAILIVGVLYSLLKPLLRASNDIGTDRKTHILKVYKERLQLLAVQHDNGEISSDAFQQAKDELELTLANELPAVDDDVHTSLVAKPNASMPIIIGLGVPVLAISLYLAWGNQQALQPQLATTEQSMPSIDEMVAQLKERVLINPEDIQGWLMLGRSHSALNQFSEARDAYMQAYQRSPDSPDILLSLAEVIGRMNGNALIGEPTELIDKALQLAPQSRHARALKGISLFQQGNSQTALSIWKTLLAEDSSNPQERELIQDFIKQAETNNNATPSSTSTNDTAAKVTVKVSLAPDLVVQTEPSDTVFIFAKAQQGPPMPLAIVRKTVADLPISVTLDDQTAMLPQMTLSKFTAVIITARISKSGDAQASSGDLQGISSVVDPKQQTHIELLINKQIP